MRYCGQCGAPLDPQALSAGRCPSCGAAISVSGDILTPAHQADPLVASAGGTTVPDVPSTSQLGLPSAPASAHWPWDSGMRTMPAPRRTTTRAMVVAGVCLLVCAVLLLCADAVLVIGSH
jgi:hypothetical protein